MCVAPSQSKIKDFCQFSVAVPEKIIGLTRFLDFFDRCHSLRSLDPPPAALPSLPHRESVSPSPIGGGVSLYRLTERASLLFDYPLNFFAYLCKITIDVPI